MVKTVGQFDVFPADYTAARRRFRDAVSRLYQAHHWGEASAATTIAAKNRLKELFCPAAPAWRSQVIERSLDLADRAEQGLLTLRSTDSIRPAGHRSHRIIGE